MKTAVVSVSRCLMLLVCLIAGTYIGLAKEIVQEDITVNVVIDTAENSPLKNYDFGTPIPNPVKPKTAIEEEKYSREGSEMAPGIRTMSASDDGIEYVVGEILYQESVTPTGGRVYTIPIMTAPQFKASPHISLQYNSQGGNGLAGFGWEIGGISAIRLINDNLYYHGGIAPASVLNGEGAYALDGVALVQNDDAVLAEEYPLETAQGHILVKKFVSIDMTTHFQVLYPDGSRATFGTPEETSRKFAFPITSWEDRLGNRITYSYIWDNSEYYIQSIEYGHKDNDAQTGSIDFTYSSRTDYVTRYYAGKECSRRKILNQITTSYEGEILSKYTLTHEFMEGVNHLIQLGCENSEGEQLPPLTFSYRTQSGDEHIASHDINIEDSLILTTYFNTSGSDEFIYNRGKFLSDNYNDGVMILPNYSNYACLGETSYGDRVFGSTYHPDQKVLVAADLREMTAVDDSIRVGYEFQYMDAADVDGDGVDEIVKVNYAETQPNSMLRRLKVTIYGYDESSGHCGEECSFFTDVTGTVIDGYTVSPVPRCYHLGDFTGSGYPQLLTISYDSDPLGQGNISYASLIDLHLEQKLMESDVFQLGTDDVIFCIDLEGDGKTELCHANPNGLFIYTYTGFNFLSGTYNPSLTSTLLKSSAYHLTDINGDGYVDIVREPEASSGVGSYWTAEMYTGSGFISQSLDIQGRTQGEKNQFIDLNKDGLADLIQRVGSSLYIYPNTNGNFNSSERICSSLNFDANTVFVPYSLMRHNTISSFISIENETVNAYRFTQDLSADRLLTEFTSSLGYVSVNNYKDMASSDMVYVTDSTRSYDHDNGYLKSRFPLQLLYNSTGYLPSSTSGIKLHSNLYYRYSDACIHNQGLGFCGFGEVRTTDMMTDLDEELVMREVRDPERMGVTTRLMHSHLLSADTPYDFTEYTYDDHSTAYGKLNPRLKKVVHTDTLAALTSSTSYSYGTYDFPTVVTTSNVSGEHRSIESHIYQYDHKTTTDNYVLGSILSDTKYLIDPVTEKEWIEKQVYTYDQKMLPLSQTGYVGDTSLHKTGETRWTYDDYGNVLTEMRAPFEVSEFIGKSYVYDEDGVNLMSMTDELGHTTTFTEYDKFGNPRKSTDFRGRTTADTYDDWGKLILRSYPDNTGYATISAWGGLSAYTVTRRTVGKPEQIVHYDAAGREVRNGTQRFNGQWIFTDTSYGRNGQVEKVSLPFKSDSEASLWNTYEYDEYMRPVSYAQASGNVTTWEYNGNTTVETRNGIWSAKTRDSRGNIIRVEDEGGAIDYTLRLDGQPAMVSVTGGGVTTIEYDRYGRRTRITDPSAGVQTDTTSYNADGGTVSVHTNPNGSIITYSDKYGRVTRIERPGEYTTDYVHDAHGRLVSETSSNGTSKIYNYDRYDRIAMVREVVPDGKFIQNTYTYSSDGNLSRILYNFPIGQTISEEYVYSNGTNTQIYYNNVLVRSIDGENEFGQPTSVLTGLMQRTYSYNQYGMPTRRTAGNVMSYQYAFDPSTGNLLYRRDRIRNISEDYDYDSLNRLTFADDRIIVYSDNGNVLYKGGVGEMAYDNTDKPYQVTSLELENTLIPTSYQNVSYTCYSRPSVIFENGISASFTYNGDGKRVKMNVTDEATQVLTRYYIGDRYEIDVTPQGTTERFYLGGDAYSAPMVMVKGANGAWIPYNIVRDYLGNITHIATKNGTLVEEYSYDAWGRMKDPESGLPYIPGSEPELMLGRGYTGHEHLTWFGLINMNARLYDPVLGRFLSPDPFVQMPDFTQNFNRYSYCLNNPLVYVDENGEIFFTTAVIIGLCVGTALGAGLGVYKGYKIAEDKGLEGSAKVWTMIGGGLIGGLAGGASAIVGAYVGSTIAIGGFIGGAYTGGAAGATAGFINGFGMSTLETGNPLFGLKQGVVQAFWGGLSGALVGGTIQGISAYSHGNKFLDGSSNLSHGGSSSNIPEYDLNPDPTGGNETLYRGITGSENYYGELYMTDNYEYASSYVKNGGNVAKIQIPKSTLELMKYNSDLCIKRGINASWSNVSYNEYVFSPQVKASIVIRFKL